MNFYGTDEDSSKSKHFVFKHLCYMILYKNIYEFNSIEFSDENKYEACFVHASRILCACMKLVLYMYQTCYAHASRILCASIKLVVHMHQTCAHAACCAHTSGMLYACIKQCCTHASNML